MRLTIGWKATLATTFWAAVRGTMLCIDAAIDAFNKVVTGAIHEIGVVPGTSDHGIDTNATFEPIVSGATV